MKTKDNLHLPILIEQDEDKIFIVTCPVFIGCRTYGKTVDEALANIREVIELCIEEEKEIVSGLNHFIGFKELQISINSAAV